MDSEFGFDLVSIIIPVYNVEKYIGKCIDSVRSQTYSNIEVIIVDDGSTDNSLSLCREFSENDNRIAIYHKDNEGLGLTRNYGLRKATGDYVTFLDSDDFLESDAIEILVRVAVSQDAEVVISGFKKVTDEGKTIFVEKYDNEFFEGDAIKNSLLPRMIGSLPDKKDSIFRMACGKLYLRQSIINQSLFFRSERTIMSEDLAFQIELLPHIKKAVVIEQTTYIYRYNPNSITTKYNENKFQNLVIMYNYVLDKINEKKLPETCVYRAQKMMFVHLLGVLKQENPRMNKKIKSECIYKINEILNNSVVIDITRQYPIGKLKFKQKVFVYMMKHRMKYSLYYILRLI